MAGTEDCPNRVGDSTCFNDRCVRGCVRNFRDERGFDVPLGAVKDVQPRARRKPWEHEMSWLMRFLSRL